MLITSLCKHWATIEHVCASIMVFFFLLQHGRNCLQLAVLHGHLDTALAVLQTKLININSANKVMQYGYQIYKYSLAQKRHLAREAYAGVSWAHFLPCLRNCQHKLHGTNTPNDYLILGALLAWYRYSSSTITTLWLFNDQYIIYTWLQISDLSAPL